MKSLLSYTILPLYRIWLRFAYDAHKIRLAKLQSRASLWTFRTFGIEFLRQDYALVLRACRASRQSVLKFLQDAAIQHAQIILQIEDSGRRP
jgi:hypothetical protein